MNAELYTSLITFIRNQAGSLRWTITLAGFGITVAVMVQTCHVTEAEKALQGIQAELRQTRELVRQERCPR